MNLYLCSVDGKCETDWRLFKENCYFFGGAENSQSGAETYCTSMSSNGNPSHLASILDADELSFIEGTYGIDHIFFMVALINNINF